MKAPLVSFVVPCFNYARYLPECVASILAQTAGTQGDDFEVIIIDDASTDATAEVMRSFRDERIRLIFHTENQGHARTATEGLEAARGTYVARIDPDDRYRSGYLDAVLPKFDAHPEVGAVYGDAAVIDAEGRVTVPRCDREHGGRDYKGNELARLLLENFICAPTLIARREAWLEALPVPEHLAFNDWYFTVMMARRWEFYYVDQVLADYRVHQSNHHTKIARNRSEESSVLWLLNRVYGEQEAEPTLELSKRRVRREAYARHSVAQADKYFGFEMNADARRCYARAVRWYPSAVLWPGVARRLAATLVERRSYEAGKRLLRTLSRQ